MVFKPHFYPPVTLPLVNIHYKELWCIRQLVRIILLLSFYWIHVIFLYISHPSLYLTFPQGILLYFKHNPNTTTHHKISELALILNLQHVCNSVCMSHCRTYVFPRYHLVLTSQLHANTNFFSHHYYILCCVSHLFYLTYKCIINLCKGQ